MERHDVRRLIVTSAFGVGVTHRDVPLIPRIFFRLKLQDLDRDKEAGEEQLRRSGLDWTLVHPTGLIDAPATGRFRAGERLRPRGFPTIPRADVAHFQVDQIDDPTYVRKGVLVSA